MKKLLIYCLAISIFIPSISGVSYANSNQTTKKLLDNGMTVLVTEMPSSPVVSVFALVKTGSATEGKFLGTGISHFLEHMLFKGTHGRGVGEVAARIQAVGGSINASTSMDYTIYTLTVPYDAFDVALEILSDMLMNSVIDPKEVERERKVIFGEMRLYRDRPDRKISKLAFKNIFMQHPYRHPIIGYESLLAEVSPEDLTKYYQTFYVPNNTIFSVSGNIDSEKVFPKIENTFKDFKRSRVIVRNLPQEPPQISSRRYEEEYPTDLTRLSMNFISISLLHPDLYALDVLANILGQGRSSRLYEDLYQQKGLVHSISSHNYTPIDKGVFGIRALLEQKNVEPVIESVLTHIEQIKTNGVQDSELEKAKQQVRSAHVLSHQTASSVAYNQAVDEAFAGDYLFSKKYVESISNVTKEDIQRVVEQYLIDTSLTTVIIKPEEKIKNETVESQEVAQGIIQKHVLDNGFTVLLREDHTFPLVAMHLTANGGVRQETSALNGLSNMMSLAWLKGTKNYSANEIAQKNEQLGIQLSSFSGRNSFGLSLQSLSEHLPVAFELLNELTMNPTFPQEEIVKVKENVKAVIRQKEDDIFSTTSQILKETLFQTHPFRLEQEGSLKTIDAITRDDMVKFYDQFMVSQNMVLSVFGDIDSKKVLAEVTNMFGGLENQSVNLTQHVEAPPKKVREQEHFMNKEQAMVMLGFQGVSLEDKDYYALDVLISILGSSFNGRIFTNIRDQLGEAYTLGGNLIPGLDSGMVYFYVLTTGKKSDQVKNLLDKEIKKIQKEYVSDKELADIKTYLKGTFKASLETSSSLSFTTNLDELYGLGYDRHVKYDTHIDQVTKEDLRRIAKEYLDLNKMAVVITKPKNDSNE